MMQSDILNIDLFIHVKPVLYEREIIINFETMERMVVAIELKPFAIGKFPITNEQYYRFIQATGYRPEDGHEYSHDIFLAHWNKGKCPSPKKTLHPVTFISWDDAVACAHFMGGRLPTYYEWLYAAFGNENNRFQWGISSHLNDATSGKAI